MQAPRRGAVRELAILLGAAVVYFGGRVLVEGSTESAHANAERLLDVERLLHIDIEASLQTWVLNHDIVRVIGNLSYVWLHWPLLLLCFWLLYHRDRNAYLQYRNTLLVSGAIGLAIFALYPMAPPRFLPDFVGTVSESARRHHLNYPLSWTNRYAAMPSFHVGWTLVACLALRSTLERTWLRAALLVPAMAVGIAVITTANHFVIDALVGTTIALGVFTYFGRSNQRTRVIPTELPTEPPTRLSAALPRIDEPRQLETATS